MRPVGVLGGTFDPIHLGHLRTALEVHEQLALRELRFIPARRPPHRPAPVAPAELRLALVEAAIAGQPGFVADPRELARNGPSYTVDTLESLRAELPGVPLVLLLGLDAFLGLPAWHRWEDVVALAHVAVMARPGWEASPPSPLKEWIATARTAEAAELARQSAGRVIFCEVTQLDISSSSLRALMAAGGDPRYLVPEAVREHLLDSGCYGPPASRAAAPGPS